MRREYVKECMRCIVQYACALKATLSLVSRKQDVAHDGMLMLGMIGRNTMTELFCS